jgi:hypothetical protein
MSDQFREIARQKAAKYGLIPEVFERQIEAESGFNPKAVSRSGALGIAQIMPTTAKGWKVNPLDPVAALDASAKNMRGYIKTFLGGKDPSKETDPAKLRVAYEKGLRAYNAGPGAVEASREYDETNRYVQKIIGPDKFSFSDVVGKKQPTTDKDVSIRQPQQGGRTFVIYGGDATMSPFDFLDRYREKMPPVRGGFDLTSSASAVDPVSALIKAFQAPTGVEYQ